MNVPQLEPPKPVNTLIYGGKVDPYNSLSREWYFVLHNLRMLYGS
jgi:hypothetical protein